MWTIPEGIQNKELNFNTSNEKIEYLYSQNNNLIFNKKILED